MSYFLCSMPNGKTPGLDSFSTDLYRFVWSRIDQLVVNYLHYAYENHSLSKKDPCLSNYCRPITLLKTGAKALACRLKRVIKQCVGGYQTGFIANRFIWESIRFILDLISHANHTYLPGLLFFLDFEKALSALNGVLLTDN